MIYMLPPCRSYLLISYTICCPLRGLAGQFFYSMCYPQKSLSDIELVERPRWLHLCIWCLGRDGYKAGLSWNSCMASPAWRSQGVWISYMTDHGFRSTCSHKQGETAWLLTWPWKSCHFTSFVLYWSRWSQACPDSRKEDVDPTSWIGETKKFAALS